MSNNYRTIGFYSILFLFTVSSLIIIGEVFVRIHYCKVYNTDIFLTEFWKDDNLIHRSSGNHRICYELKPNYTSGDISTNAFGFRGRSYPQIKPADSYRIMVFGDSVTFGQGVLQNQTFPQKLEEFLNDTNPSPVNFEVLNAGVIGYNAYQEIESFFHSGLPLNPDMVIFNYVLNDQMVEDGGLTWYFNRRNRFLLKFIFQKKYFQLRSFLNEPPASSQKPIKKYNGLFEQKHYDPDVQAKYSRELQRVKKACLEKNIQPVLVIFPLFLVIKDHPLKGIHTVVRDIAEKNGFEVIDLWQAYKGYSEKEVSEEYLHPNANGLKIAAKFVGKYLRKTRLIPLSVKSQAL